MLPAFSEDLSEYAKKALGKLGVEVRLGQPVTAITDEGVTIGDVLVPCRTVVWAAGVQASPAAKWLDAPADRAGRARVGPDLAIENDPNVFVIGDTALVNQENGAPVPGIAPAAKQQGRHVARTIKPALAAHKWVIADRFTDSTYVYQGAGRKLRAQKIAAIEDAVLEGLEPDLTLILDLPVQEGLKRAHARRGNETRFEKFDLDFHQRLRDSFHEIAKAHPERCVLIDASGSEEEVAGRIWREVQSRFGI